MHIEVNKITKDKKNRKLHDNRQHPHLDRYDIPDAKNILEKRIKCFHKNIRDCIKTDEGKQEEIEEHVEDVQPEIFFECTL